ncbi:hypothetical protein pVa21_087 [Vibrio phage pVa-21]|nr:hypothetical protein pVa21_087 [Vibrio phage pVa-21]
MPTSGYSDLDTPEMELALESERPGVVEVNNKSDVQAVGALFDQLYKRVEIVHAVKITEIHGNNLTLSEHEISAVLSFDDQWFAINRPAVGGYIVFGEDNVAKYLDELTFCKQYHPSIKVAEPQPLLT